MKKLGKCLQTFKVIFVKTIGIVGGLSPESTVLYYLTIVREFRSRFNSENYPNIIIYSVSFGEFTRHVASGNREEAVKILLEALKALHRAGADFAIISANTPHMFFNELSSKTPIPLISIIDSLAEKLIEDNVGKVGLLGTKYTLTHKFYIDGLKRYGIEAIVPEKDDIEVVNKIIYEELTKGIINEHSRRKLLTISEKLIGKGAEAVALACTELPLILKDGMANIKFYDTAKIHAIKDLEYALK